MNIQEMHYWFNLLLDSYNEPYFIEEEVDTLINVAQTQLVNDIVFPDHSNSLSQNESGKLLTNTVDGSIQTSEVLRNLSYDVFFNSSLNRISYNLINDNLSAKILEVTGQEEDSRFIHIQSIKRITESGKEMPLKFVRKSDKPRFEDNVFKRSSDLYPTFLLTNRGIETSVIGLSDYEISLIKSPRKVSLELNISSDLPTNIGHKIVSYALSASGLANRDDVMLQLQKISGNEPDR